MMIYGMRKYTVVVLPLDPQPRRDTNIFISDRNLTRTVSRTHLRHLFYSAVWVEVVRDIRNQLTSTVLVVKIVGVWERCGRLCWLRAQINRMLISMLAACSALRLPPPAHIQSWIRTFAKFEISQSQSWPQLQGFLLVPTSGFTWKTLLSSMRPLDPYCHESSWL